MRGKWDQEEIADPNNDEEYYNNNNINNVDDNNNYKKNIMIMIMINKDNGDHLEIIDHKNKEPRAKFSSLRDTRWNRTLFCGAIR